MTRGSVNLAAAAAALRTAASVESDRPLWWQVETPLQGRHRDSRSVGTRIACWRLARNSPTHTNARKGVRGPVVGGWARLGEAGRQ